MSINHNELYQFGAYRFDALNGLLWHRGELISVKPKPIALLKLLIQQPGEVVSKQKIMESLWPDTIVEEANLTQTIHLLRKALSQDKDSTILIETVPKIGYRWTGEISAVGTNNPSLANVVNVTDETPVTSKVAESQQTREGENQPADISSALSFDKTSSAALPAAALSNQENLPPAAPLVWWRNHRVAWTVVGILMVFGMFAGTVFSRRSGNSKAVRSIAILPFGNLGTESLDPSLSLGLADVLITRLSSQERLDIRPTSAVTRYSDNKTDALTAGHQLGVETVLTGNIYRSGEHVRITAQLVRVDNGSTVWTEVFDESFANLFALQDNLTRQVSTVLRMPLESNPQKLAQDYGTANLAAWQLYQKGRYYWNKRQWTWTKKAIEAFNEAIQLDANYAQAYAGLADSYALWNPEMTPRERLAKAKPAAQKALALNEKLAEAHASLGFIKYKFEWDWSGSEAEFRRALEIQPNYVTAHHWFGESLSLRGKHAEALERLREAERLDPLSFPVKEDIGLALYRARDYANAERKFREVLDLDPNFVRTRRKLSDLLQTQGRYDEALQENLKFWQAGNIPADTIATLQQAFQKSGWQGVSRLELDLIQAGKLQDDAHRRARLSVRAGDHEQAMKWLTHSCDELGEAPLRLAEPEFDPLRADTKFQALLRRTNHSE